MEVVSSHELYAGYYSSSVKSHESHDWEPY